MSVLAEKLLERLSEIEKTGRLGPAPIGYMVDDGGTGYCVMPEEVSLVYQSEETERSAVLLLCAALREVVEHFRNLIAKYKHLKSLDYLLHEQVAELRTVEALIADFAAVTLPALARGYGLEVEA